MNSTFNNISSNNVQHSLDTLQVAVNIVYIITGIFSAVSNLVILHLFLLYKTLQKKEILILFGLATSDFIYCTGYLIGGIRRL